MSDLLAIGRSGVLAYKGALAAVSENVTNADTDGFARRTVTLKEQSSAGGPYATYHNSTAFSGVQATDVTRVWDQYKAATAWSANSDAGRSATRSQYLSTVEDMLDDGDTGVGTKLTAIFTSGTQLAANPSDTALRQTMLGAIGDAASAISRTGANLGKVANTVQTQATTVVDQTNDALAALAKVNIGLRGSPAGSPGRAQLEDQRDSLIGTLSGNLSLDVTIDGQGAAALKLNDASGALLLAANVPSPAYLTLQTAADGRLGIQAALDGTTSVATPIGGALAGLVEISATIAGRRQQIDGLAGRLVTTMNDWQAQGTTAAGAAGAPLLTGTSAATIALTPAGQADIAAADATSANGNLLALSALRGSDGAEATWQTLVTSQALQVSSAKSEAAATASRKDSAYTALDATSGVDLDVEAAELMRFQQAYSASAKIIQAARDTFQTILALF